MTPIHILNVLALLYTFYLTHLQAKQNMGIELVGLGGGGRWLLVSITTHGWLGGHGFYLLKKSHKNFINVITRNDSYVLY